MESSWWAVIFTSAAVSTLVGGLLSGAFGLRTKRNEYENDYYKLVIGRRIAAYDLLEALILRFKDVQITNEGKGLHWALSSEEHLVETFRIHIKATSAPLWISQEMHDLTRQMNLELNRASNFKAGPAAYGTEHYRKLANLRESMERLHASDMMNLHNVKAFLKAKRSSTRGFEDVDIGKR